MEQKLNILYLVNQNTYRTKMSRVRFHGMKAVGKKTNIIWSGIGWKTYDGRATVQHNIEKIEDKMRMKFDIVVAYKPGELKNFSHVKIPKCIRFNEMYNFPETVAEIESSMADLVICHHENDLPVYREYFSEYHGQKNRNVKFVHIPHCAHSGIFKKYDEIEKKYDLLMCGHYGNKNSLGDQHYPLRNRFVNVILKKMEALGYKCGIYKHPGYNRNDSFKDTALIEFAKGINSTKICLTCTGVPKSRFGKYIEIPMCGVAIAGDIPNQDQKEFREFVIEIDMSMTDDQIVEKLKWYIDHDDQREKLVKKGLEWSAGWTQDKYGELFVKEVNKFLGREVEGEEGREGERKREGGKDGRKQSIYVHGASEDWIIDNLKDEWCKLNSENCNIVTDPNKADIIWLIAPYKWKDINIGLLKEKRVITTIHHINKEKISEYLKLFSQLEQFTNTYHVIDCNTEALLKGYVKREIIYLPFWIDENKWYSVEKEGLREKCGLPENKFLIGSFQRDTEGASIANGKFMPKLEKGPDRFVKIVEMLWKINKEVEVVLTGYRRQYVCKELDKIGIKYHYFEKIEQKKINDLYNCLDLYIISARVEGAPRSVLECATIGVPVISTNVGIVGDILDPISIYNGDKLETVLDAMPNIVEARKRVDGLLAENYMEKFNSVLFG